MITTSNVKTALKIDLAVSQEMANALQKWSLAYVNQPAWYKEGMKKLNLAATIASEIARAATIEMQVKVSGSPRAEYLALQLAPVIDQARVMTEYGVAKGGLVFKPFVSGKSIHVDYVQADQFYPVSFDANGKITAGVFSDQRIVGSNYYTRLEYHTMTDKGCEVVNMAFRSASKNDLGSRVALSVVDAWANLQEYATITGIDRPLFAYFKNPVANNIDPTSPLGVSCIARAYDMLEQADQQWTDFLWEFESGKRALYVDETAFEVDKATGKRILPHKLLYRLLKSSGAVGKGEMFEEWTPTLREVNMLNGLDGILKRIEFNCGLAQGTISDPNAVALTATEIKMSRQRTYATITDTQKALQNALEDLLYAMDAWTSIAGLAPEGAYATTYTFDDSIVADHDTQFSQDMQVLDRVISKVEFRMRNYGESLEEAQKMIALVQAEQPDPNTLLNNFGA